MMISTKKPDCWPRLVEAFGVDWDKGMVVAWKGKIHTKSGVVSEQILAHEMVHLKQQDTWDPERYLDMYIKNNSFRLSMELEAFQAEVAWIHLNIHDEKVLERKLDWIYQSLATNYGGMITYDKAKQIL